MCGHMHGEPNVTVRETNSSCNGRWHFKAGSRVFSGFGCQWALESLLDFLSMNLRSPTFFHISPPHSFSLTSSPHSTPVTWHPAYLWSPNWSFWQSVSLFLSASDMERRFSFFIFYLPIPFEAALDVSFILLQPSPAHPSHPQPPFSRRPRECPHLSVCSSCRG